MTALVEQQDTGPDTVRYLARVEGIDLWAEGASADSAREELVQAMLSWISTQDCAESMSVALAAAGYPEIDDDTELELEFAEQS